MLRPLCKTYAASDVSIYTASSIISSFFDSAVVTAMSPIVLIVVRNIEVSGSMPSTIAAASTGPPKETMIEIKNKFGKNAILAGTSYQEGATGRDRNRQIGGHKA